MTTAILPMFSFSEQCEWLRRFLDRPPSIATAELHEWALWHAVDELFMAGEIRLAVTVAWLSIIRSADPAAENLVAVQAAVRNGVIFGEPGLVESCLESPSRAGEGVAGGA